MVKLSCVSFCRKSRDAVTKVTSFYDEIVHVKVNVKIRER